MSFPKHIGLFFEALVVVGLVLCGINSVSATPIGTPSCSAGSCTLAITGGVFNTTAIPGSPFSFDVELLFPFHIQLFNSDSAPETINFTSTTSFLSNNVNGPNPYTTHVQFKDMNGGGPVGLDVWRRSHQKVEHLGILAQAVGEQVAGVEQPDQLSA